MLRYDDMLAGLKDINTQIAIQKRDMAALKAEYAESEKKVDEYTKRLRALQKEQKQLDAAHKAGKETDFGYEKRSREIENEIAALKRLRSAEQKRAQQELPNLISAQTEYEQTIKALQAQQRSLTSELQATIKLEDAQAGSVAALQAQIKQLTAQYNRLDWKSDEAQSLAKNINALEGELKQAKGALGDFRENVGDYENAIRRALPLGNSFLGQILGITQTKGGVKAAFSALLNGIKSTTAAILASPLFIIAATVTAIAKAFQFWKSSAHETQTAGDALDIAVAGWTAGWREFKSMVSTFDFSNFIDRIKGAISAGMELQAVLDGLTEQNNALRLWKAENAQYKAQLEDTMRDQTKSVEERRRASRELIRLAEEEARVTVAIAKQERDAQAKRLVQRMKGYESITQVTQQEIDDLNKNLQGLGANYANISATLEQYYELPKKKRGAFWASLDADTQRIVLFLSQYNQANDELVSDYVNAQVAMSEATANAFQQNKRVYTMSHTLEKQMTDDAERNMRQRADIERQIAAETAAMEAEASGDRIRIINNDYDTRIAVIRQRIDEETNLTIEARQNLEKQILLLENDRVQDIAAVQREELQLRKSFEAMLRTAVLAAAQQTAEVQKQNIDRETSERIAKLREAYERLTNATVEDERKLQEAIAAVRAQGEQKKTDIDNADYRQRLTEEMRRKELELQNRILQAQNEANASGGDPAAAARAVAQAELDAARQKYNTLLAMDTASKNALYASDEEYKNARLQQEAAVQAAVQRTTDLEEAERRAMLQQTSTMINGIGNLMGAMQSVFQSLGEEGEQYAEFARAMGVMQVILQQAVAIASAIANASNAPWFMIPITIATSVATVTAAIMGAVSQAKQTKVPKYAEGGLITGAGTGTSDSITARVSNGEAVMTAKAVDTWGDVLSAMNVASGGRAITAPARMASRGGAIVSSQQMGDIMSSFEVRMQQRDEHFVNAIKAIRPRVAVDEFQTVEDKVETINTNSQIKR